MVPHHRFNELKPNSGCGCRNSPELTKNKIRRENEDEARRNDVRNPATPEFLWQACVPFVVKQMREKLPDISRRIEMSGHALGATAAEKADPIHIRHDGKYRFVGDVVADEERTTPPEGLVRHQFAHAGRLGESG